MMVQDEHQMVLTLSEHDPPCSGQSHVLRVFLLPTELAQGLATQREEGMSATVSEHKQMKQRSCSIQTESPIV